LTRAQLPMPLTIEDLIKNSEVVGNKYPDEQSALVANLNQAMIFITHENAKFIPAELLTLSKQNNGHLKFTSQN